MAVSLAFFLRYKKSHKEGEGVLFFFLRDKRSHREGEGDFFSFFWKIHQEEGEPRESEIKHT